jgi:hypothetical protein
MIFAPFWTERLQVLAVRPVGADRDPHLDALDLEDRGARRRTSTKPVSFVSQILW